MIKYLP